MKYQKYYDEISSKKDILKQIYPTFKCIKYILLISGRIVCRIDFDNGEYKYSQYARYLMEINLQRVLSNDETVDHIDGDKLNNSIENLQILSRSDNAKKGSSKEIKELQRLKLSLIQKNNINIRGEKCNLHKLTEEQVKEIKYTNSFMSNKDLAIKYNVSHSAIAQIKRGDTWKWV